MKAISIIQPWATLIALGEKKFETRSWPTKYRGELAIHASKKIDKDVCRLEPFKSVLAKHGYSADNLPIGVILATCRLADCHKIISVGHVSATLYAEGIPKVTGNEFSFGWYEFGRFAWELMDVIPLNKPIPEKGQLGIWNWEGDLSL